MSWALAALDTWLLRLTLDGRDAKWWSPTMAVVPFAGQQNVGLLFMPIVGSSVVYTPTVMFLLYLPGGKV